jgi:hypothetical protein
MEDFRNAFYIYSVPSEACIYVDDGFDEPSSIMNGIIFFFDLLNRKFIKVRRIILKKSVWRSIN